MRARGGGEDEVIDVRGWSSPFIDGMRRGRRAANFGMAALRMRCRALRALGVRGACPPCAVKVVLLYSGVVPDVEAIICKQEDNLSLY